MAADKPQHASTFSQSYILSRNVFMQNIHCMPYIPQVKANHALFSPESPSQSHTNTSKSSNSSNSSTDDRKDQNNPPKPKNLPTIFRLATTTTLAPLERASMLMQCQNELIKTGRLLRPYNGMTDCFLRTIKHEGVLSLWRGNSVNVARMCSAEAMSYVLRGIMEKNKKPPKNNNEAHFGLVAISVMSTNLFYYPLNFARTRLATDVKAPREMHFSLDMYSSSKGVSNYYSGSARRFTGAFDVLKKTLKSDGIRGVFRGYTLSCIDMFVQFYTARAVSSSISGMQNQEKPDKNVIALLVMGWGTLIVALYPLNTLSRRIMMTSGEAQKYKGALDALYQIVKYEGVASLYKGVIPFVLISPILLSLNFGYRRFLS